MKEIRNATLITNNDHNEVIENAVVQIDGGKIKYAGSSYGAPVFHADKVIDGTNKAVMPGFINTHTHVPMNLFRAYADDMSLMDWLNKKIFPAEDKLTKESAYWASLSAMCEMAGAGIVAFNDQYFFVDEIAAAAQKSGLRGILSRGIVTPAPGVGERMLDESVELFEKYNNVGRLKVYLGPHAQYTVNTKMLEKIAEKAKELRTGIHMHVSETRDEQEACIRDQGLTPIALCKQVGLLDSPFLAAHCVWVSDEDMDIMGKYGVSVLSCPRSNLKLASGIAPLTKMRKRDVRVTIGTDSVASNNKLSVMSDMTYASLLQKGTTYDAETFNAVDTLKCATSEGAAALGLNSGVIEEGKDADLIMIDMSGIRFTPEYDVIPLIVYSASDNDVCMTMVGGDIIYEDGKFAFADVDEVEARVREYSLELKKNF